MTHQDRDGTPQDLPARPKADPIHPRRRTLKGFLLQGKNGAGDSELGWVIGLAGQSEADANFAAVLNQLQGTEFQAFTLSAWIPGRSGPWPVLLAGPVTHVAFRVAIPLGSPGWGWFSMPFLQCRGAKAEAWLGVPFLSGRLVPYPSVPARGGAGNPLGSTGFLGQPIDSVLERP